MSFTVVCMSLISLSPIGEGQYQKEYQKSVAEYSDAQYRYRGSKVLVKQENKIWVYRRSECTVVED